MKYLVRLNPKAFNPITRNIEQSRFWEVEQCADKDSEKVIWHCAKVMIGDRDVQGLFQAADNANINAAIDAVHAVGLKPVKTTSVVELEFHGICVRGQDNAIVIKEGRHDIS